MFSQLRAGSLIKRTLEETGNQEFDRARGVTLKVTNMTNTGVTAQIPGQPDTTVEFPASMVNENHFTLVWAAAQ